MHLIGWSQGVCSKLHVHMSKSCADAMLSHVYTGKFLDKAGLRKVLDVVQSACANTEKPAQAQFGGLDVGHKKPP